MALGRLSKLLTARQRILEDLLKAEELQDAEIHSGVESKATLVRPKCRVELHAESAVHMHSTLVILPDDSELDDSLWDRGDLEGLLVFRILFEECAMLEGRGKL